MKTKDTKEIIDYIEKLPDLDWIISYATRGIDYEVYYSITPFGKYYIRYFYEDMSLSLYFNEEKLMDNFKTIEEIKKKANDDYKNRLKMALNL